MDVNNYGLFRVKLETSGNFFENVYGIYGMEG